MRGIITALLTPVRFAYESGHFRSSLKGIAVSRTGSPIPWYTYPCIEFLATRSFAGRRILEAGAGQSTLWWAARATLVCCLEEDRDWYVALKKRIPGNVMLSHIAMDSVDKCLDDVRRALEGQEAFDVIVIDGLYRSEVLEALIGRLKPDGAIVCDDSEGYGFFDVLRRNKFQRIDFFGYAPAVVNSHCTSIAFRDSCFLFLAEWPIRSSI